MYRHIANVTNQCVVTVEGLSKACTMRALELLLELWRCQGATSDDSLAAKVADDGFQKGPRELDVATKELPNRLSSDLPDGPCTF